MWFFNIGIFLWGDLWGDLWGEEGGGGGEKCTCCWALQG